MIIFLTTVAIVLLIIVIILAIYCWHLLGEIQKQDLEYLALSKELSQWKYELTIKKQEEEFKQKTFDFPSLGRDDCFHGGPCTNPHYDCINCPRIFKGNGTTISTTQDNL